MPSLKELKPYFCKSIQDEIDAFSQISDLFPGSTMKQIVSKFVKYQKEQRTLPDGFAKRVQWFRAGQWPDSEVPESGDSIVADYKKFTSTNAKALGKLLGINITNPKDEQETTAFAIWLNGGANPPTEQEKVSLQIHAYADEILGLMDKRAQGTISIEDCVRDCKTIVVYVQKQYKAPGLLVLGDLIHVPGNPKDTPAKLAKALNAFFDDRGQKWKRDLDIDPNDK